MSAFQPPACQYGFWFGDILLEYSKTLLSFRHDEISHFFWLIKADHSFCSKRNSNVNPAIGQSSPEQSGEASASVSSPSVLLGIRVVTGKYRLFGVPCEMFSRCGLTSTQFGSHERLDLSKCRNRILADPISSYLTSIRVVLSLKNLQMRPLFHLAGDEMPTVDVLITCCGQSFRVILDTIQVACALNHSKKGTERLSCPR